MVQCMNGNCDECVMTSCYQVSDDGSLITLKPCGNCPKNENKSSVLIPVNVMKVSDLESEPNNSNINEKTYSSLHSSCDDPALSDILSQGSNNITVNKMSNISDAEINSSFSDISLKNHDGEEETKIDSDADARVLKGDNEDNLLNVSDISSKNDDVNDGTKKTDIADSKQSGNSNESSQFLMSDKKPAESLKDIQTFNKMRILNQNSIETTVGEYSVNRGKYLDQGKIIFQKNRESDKTEILSAYNDGFIDKFICEGLFVRENKRQKGKDLLLAPSRTQTNVILLAIELNGKGTAKPLFYNERKKNIYYGSCSDLDNIDTMKTYQDFDDDEIHNLSQILFGWLSPHVNMSKKKPIVAVKLEDENKLSSKKPRTLAKTITPAIKAPKQLIDKDNIVQVNKTTESKMMVAKIRKIEKILEDEKNKNSKILLKSKIEKNQSAEVIANLKRKLADADSKAKVKSQPVTLRTEIATGANHIPPVFDYNSSNSHSLPNGYPTPTYPPGYQNNPHGYTNPTDPYVYPPHHNPNCYPSGPTNPPNYPPNYNPYGYSAPTHPSTYPPHHNPTSYPTPSHAPNYSHGYPQVFGFPPNHPTHGYQPATKK